MTPHVEKEKNQKDASLKSNMEPKYHPIEKEHHLPNLHFFRFQPLIFLFFFCIYNIYMSWVWLKIGPQSLKFLNCSRSSRRSGRK